MSGKTVSMWVRDARWPFKKRGPWKVQDIEQWRNDTLAPNPADTSPLKNTSTSKLQIAKTAAQIGVLQERRAKLELERLIAQGEYIRKDEIEARTISNNTAIRVGLVRLARSLRQHLADEDEPHKCEQMLVTAFTRLFDSVLGHAEREGDGHAN